MIKRIWAAIERLLSPSLGTCLACNRPWRVPAAKRVGRNELYQLNRDRFWGLVGVKSHTTNFTEGHGCFPLCEGCWSSMTPLQRIPYYNRLIAQWRRFGPVDTETVVRIMSAVLEGK